jgi:hypothetical protein
MNINEYADWAESKWFSTGAEGFGERDITIMSLGLAR